VEVFSRSCLIRLNTVELDNVFVLDTAEPVTLLEARPVLMVCWNTIETLRIQEVSLNSVEVVEVPPR
jgi:hypothetical protein